MSDEQCVEIRLRGNDRALWMRPEHLERGHGPLMPKPDHDLRTFGLGISYAHLYPDGKVRRYGSVIADRADILEAVGGQGDE